MSKQIAKGNQIQQAGRDINTKNFYLNDFPISLSYEELERLIKSLQGIDFGESPNMIKKLKRINIKKKNKINNLTDATFKTIIENYLPRFDDIYSFLSNPANIILKDIYFGLANDIHLSFVLAKSVLPNFDYFFAELIQKVENRYGSLSHTERDKYMLLFSFMYWYCDVGLRE